MAIAPIDGGEDVAASTVSVIIQWRDCGAAGYFTGGADLRTHVLTTTR